MLEAAVTFRALYFPDATDDDWNDWRWQLKNRMRDRESLESVFNLTADEEDALERLGGRIPVSVTPYYASRLMPRIDTHPLRKTVVPHFHIGKKRSLPHHA